MPLIITAPMNLGSHVVLITCCLVPDHSFISHAKTIPNPSYVVHNSCQTYKILFIYMSIITQSYSTKTDHSGKIKHPKHSTVSPSISLRLRGLAQARHARSGEPPPRLGESAKKKGMGNTGSRLSEIPLAWASCLPAQKLSESPGRRFAQKLRRAPCFISPRRDELAWARLTGLATVLRCTTMFFIQVTHAKHSNIPERNITP